MMTNTFQLSGLHCNSCKKIIEKRVNNAIDGARAEVNLDTQILVVSSDQPVAKDQIEQALLDTDYKVL